VRKHRSLSPSASVGGAKSFYQERVLPLQMLSKSGIQHMRLAEFIEQHAEEILAAAEEFAGQQLPAGDHLDAEALRDHMPMILHAIVIDLRSPQTGEEEVRKSHGHAALIAGAPATAAQIHALLRAKSGFQIEQMVSEYRALRASVLRLWASVRVTLDADVIADLVRFNEAIDQAVAESVAHFAAEADRWRHVFLAVLGHDLRGPLNAVLLTAQLLERLGGEGPVSDHTARLIRSGKRMQELLDNLLDYSRSSLGYGIVIERVDSNLADACHEEVDLLRAAFPGYQIQFDVEGATHGLYDASRIREALSNLVSNATRYAANKLVRVTLHGTGSAVRLSVENAGASLPQSDLRALFEPLRRGREDSEIETASRTNLGLGLFIVQQIAKAHGGGLDAVSVDSNTTFTMTFPAEP
jgi:signal transduction histidine kinase